MYPVSETTVACLSGFSAAQWPNTISLSWWFHSSKATISWHSLMEATFPSEKEMACCTWTVPQEMTITRKTQITKGAVTLSSPPSVPSNATDKGEFGRVLGLQPQLDVPTPPIIFWIFSVFSDKVCGKPGRLSDHPGILPAVFHDPWGTYSNFPHLS